MKKINGLGLDDQVLTWQKTCLRSLFAIGMIDSRNSPKCQFATYILLAMSIFMVSVIGFKFIASIKLGSERAPEDHDKFVICQVLCYTEGVQSLQRTIDSLAQLKYDDKCKLLPIVCDGMVVGSGNDQPTPRYDQPTPRIALDVLSAPPNIDAGPLSFLSIGEGTKQHNTGKCGKPGEKSRPGNRGKRDTQMLLVRFLNKVRLPESQVTDTDNADENRTRNPTIVSARGCSDRPTKMMDNGYAESHTASIYPRETYYEPAMSRAYSAFARGLSSE
ncbi:hypothetical protein EVJ58_g6811 [Rhodofomes roseus]|uniref:Uncharacterized protein n=1 Tax=Rhodofomes roseus TaxID=34475 RepID=A0A4Y9Y7B0_9APHY|nr:hypothetical protein EVJ58_g6811 [Rhodofomes roseus]